MQVLQLHPGEQPGEGDPHPPGGEEPGQGRHRGVPHLRVLRPVKAHPCTHVLKGQPESTLSQRCQWCHCKPPPTFEQNVATNWYHPQELSSGTTNWHQPLELSSGTTNWHHLKELFSGITNCNWHHLKELFPVVQPIGTI